MVLTPRRWCQVRGKQNFSRMTVARKPGHRGERGVSRKPLRREGRIASAEPVCSCAFFCAFGAHETAGAARIRLSLRPLVFQRVAIDAKLGRIAPRECGRTSSRCMTIESYEAPSLRAKRSNPCLNKRINGLPRGACHRARICATRWLAMTWRERSAKIDLRYAEP